MTEEIQEQFVDNQKTYKMYDPKIRTSKYTPGDLANKNKIISESNNIISESDKSNSDRKHRCFTIKFLFKDLFDGNKDFHLPAIIPSFRGLSRKEAIFSFIFPDDVLQQIKDKIKEHNEISLENRKKFNSTMQSDKIKEDHFANFLRQGTYDNVLSDCLYKVYDEMGWKKFIESIQEHITSKLKDIDLKTNSDLINYLETVGNTTIVPEQTSPKANAAFLRLIDDGKNDSNALALIIANFIISCLLGIRSMKTDNVYDSPKLRAYILSSNGMERIWRPDLISPPYERLYDSRRLFENANYEGAITTIEDWLKEYEQEASNEAKALAYQILGISLYNLSSSGDEKCRDGQSTGIEWLEKCISTGEADLSVFYFLYDKLKGNAPEDASEYLKTAFVQNYAKAVIEVGSLYLKDVYIFDDVTEKSLLEKINYIIEHEQKNDVVDAGKCLYLYGCFEKNAGNDSTANDYFEAAASKGNERAKQEIKRNERMERHSFPAFTKDDNSPCCFVNTLTGNNLAVLSSFPESKWSLYTTDSSTLNKDIQVLQDIDDFIELKSIGKYAFDSSHIVFILMSENNEKNLNECLSLLDKLFNKVLNLSEDKKIKQLIDSIDIYVSAQYEIASMLIDASISNMGKNMYFKIHITDETRDSIHQLLCDAPLFLPALSGTKKEAYTNVILFGDSETNYEFIKESIACAYIGTQHPITITMLGRQANTLKNRFKRECPGIYNENTHISCIRPGFIECNIDEFDFPDYIYGNKHISEPDDEIVKVLNAGNYFVIDLKNDFANIRFGMELRTWLLRSRGTFDRAPFIAVKVSDEQNSYLTSHLTLTGQDQGNSFYNQYDLFPFGVVGHVYSYQNMIEKPVLMDLALRIHKSYCDNDEKAAENSFYSYSYNADSSLLTAVGLCYRFFAASSFFKDKNQYLNYGALCNSDLLSDFEKRINNEELMSSLAAIEQARWNGFMLTRGWESANLSQVQAYKEQSTGSQHKHLLAKLHPFILEWNDLDNPDLLKILGILKTKFDYDKKPQTTTKKSIENTAKFFESAVKATEQTRE